MVYPRLGAPSRVGVGTSGCSKTLLVVVASLILLGFCLFKLGFVGDVGVPWELWVGWMGSSRGRNALSWRPWQGSWPSVASLISLWWAWWWRTASGGVVVAAGVQALQLRSYMVVGLMFLLDLEAPGQWIEDRFLWLSMWLIRILDIDSSKKSWGVRRVLGIFHNQVLFVVKSQGSRQWSFGQKTQRTEEPRLEIGGQRLVIQLLMSYFWPGRYFGPFVEASFFLASGRQT